MTSTFTWLDYSEYERRKMLDVIGLFGERTTRDELGLGSVRDAFADMFFPGTSTIQTRAKYFLFVPWVYLILERRRTPSSSVERRARALESELMRALEASGDQSGLIGRRVKEKVQRLPSNIYWQGLGVWGIRLFSGSQDEYHCSLDIYYIRQREHRSAQKEFEGEAADQAELHNWHPGLPPGPDDFPRVASFALARREAEYLRERVLTQCPQSLLACLLRERIGVGDVEFAWDLACRVPPEHQTQLEHGRNLSEVMHGAQLLYNLMLAELCSSDDWIAAYRWRLSSWWSVVDRRRTDLRSWDRDRFWQLVYQQNPRVSPRARRFIDQWADLVIDARWQDAVVEGASARQLIEHREVQLKGRRARLRNERARELWQGAAGADQLDLRWRAARRIIADILAGLGEHGNA